MPQKSPTSSAHANCPISCLLSFRCALVPPLLADKGALCRKGMCGRRGGLRRALDLLAHGQRQQAQVRHAVGQRAAQRARLLPRQQLQMGRPRWVVGQRRAPRMRRLRQHHRRRRERPLQRLPLSRLRLRKLLNVSEVKIKSTNNDPSTPIRKRTGIKTDRIVRVIAQEGKAGL